MFKMLYPTWTHVCVFLSLIIFSFENRAYASPSGKTTAPNAHKNHPNALHHFASRSAQQYMVPRKLPLMDFTLPQTYAGIIDVSVKPSESNELFFWFVPTQNPIGRKDLALWSNGGPGCSSLLGAFQENGPIMWDEGRKTPIANPNSWHNQANMLYLEHPANVGFSRGNIVINNEDQIALYIFTFLQKFLVIFPEMRQANFYFTGESYAGMYLSYAADYLYRHQANLELNLQGILLVDALISLDALQTHAPTLNFIKKHNEQYLKLNSTVLAAITKSDGYCGGSEYIMNNLKFPASRFPNNRKLLADPMCRMWDQMAEALPISFNLYNIAQQHKGFDFATVKPSYFDRPDVRKALNAERGNPRWAECSNSRNIFPSGDSSVVPVARVLPDVINKSKRTVILHGELDGVLLLEGMTLAIQGFAWGNKYGFQKPIDRQFMVGGKKKGQYQSERGLTYIQVADAGHMIPHDQPEAALSAFEYLLGRRENV